MSHRDHQAGFSALWALLIVVVLVAIGLSGWWVWRDKHKTSSTSPLTTTTTTIKSKTQTPKTMVEPDPTTSWTPYSSKAGKFSLKYPPTWVQAASPDLCAAGLVLLGPTKDSVGHCGSEDFGEVAISSIDGDLRANYELDTGYQSLTKEAVTVSGVTGKQESGVAKGQQSGSDALGGLPDGTIVVKYIFFVNGKTYIASYNQTSGYPDALKDFNLLVTKTLKFN